MKKGSTSFLQEFAKEIEAFEFNEKAINEIIAPIEKTYQYFGVQGIIEHYSLVPLKRDEEEKKPFEIPFFKKPIVIIYDEKDKEGETYAELLMTYIHETLDSFGLSCPVSKTSDADAHAKMERFEKEEYIIYVGEPKHANSLIKAIETKKKWEFKKYGMRYGNLGYQSILSVQPIKKKQYSEFLEFIKEKESRWEEDASKTVTSLKTPTCEFEKGHGGEAIFVNFCLATTGSPLWLAGSLLDLISKHELKKQLIKLQYCVLIDEFVSSKVNPYIQ